MNTNVAKIETDHIQTRERVLSARRIVIKIGSGVLFGKDRSVESQIRCYAATAAGSLQNGRQVVLVTSGAVRTGCDLMGISPQNLDSTDHSTAAALGQSRLVASFYRTLSAAGVRCGQLLVSRRDIDETTRKLDLLATIESMLQRDVLPLVNENDALTHGRGDDAFLDNDSLAASLAIALNADLLILLTSVAGIFFRDPIASPSAQIVPILDESQPVIIEGNTTSIGGRGGIQSKIRSAVLASRHGCAAVIANGENPATLSHVLAGETIGTWVPPLISNQKRGVQ